MAAQRACAKGFITFFPQKSELYDIFPKKLKKSHAKYKNLWHNVALKFLGLKGVFSYLNQGKRVNLVFFKNFIFKGN